jgi:hypothetical protein
VALSCLRARGYMDGGATGITSDSCLREGGDGGGAVGM